MSDEQKRRPWRTDAQLVELRERIAAAEDGLMRRRFRPTPWAVAAGVVLAAGVIGIWVSRGKTIAQTDAAPIVVTTGPGQRSTVRLTDSSTVVLGPSSRLSYVEAEAARTVTLSGWASFVVTHDATRPFSVRARNGVATDIGTEFIVRAYDSDSVLEVAVSSGAVLLRGEHVSLELRAGSVGRVDTLGHASRLTAAEVAGSADWLNGRLEFKNVELRNVAADLHRWFDVEISVSDDALRHRRLTATYNNASLDGVLNALSATLGLRVARNGRMITLSEGDR